MADKGGLSVIIPAHNEADQIGGCLAALLASDPRPRGPVRLIVVANGCTDDTFGVARGFETAVKAAGWSLMVFDLPAGGKLNALNWGEKAAGRGARAYLDADVRVSPGLLAALVAALADPAPRFVSGSPVVDAPPQWVGRAYARFWQDLPYVRDGAPGFGLFAVNAAGRARWDAFPDIIADDAFVRLHFAPAERIRLADAYHWPLVEGFANLVRVRRRQDRGVAEVNATYPDLAANGAGDRPNRATVIRRALRDPLGFAVYAAVAVAVRLPLFGRAKGWVRGR